MSFVFIAPHYRWLERTTFQNALQKARIFFLDQIPAPQHVLMAGEGNGRFLRVFARKFPEARIDCVDASARMLSLVRQQLQDEQNIVRFLQKDLLTWIPDEGAYDLIVTHYFLDCFDERELKEIIGALASSATPNAIWLLADFSLPSGVLRKMHAQVCLWAMHRFFRTTGRRSAQKLIDPSPILETHRFRRVKRERWRGGLVASELWKRIDCSAIRTIRGIRNVGAPRQ